MTLMTRKIFSLAILFTLALLGTEVAEAQRGAGFRGNGGSGRAAARGGGARRASGARAGQRAVGASPWQAGFPTGNVSFPSNLGNTVGLQSMPLLSMPPGVGNINQPGIQPLAINPQPFPLGGTPGHRSINYPGGSPYVNGKAVLTPPWSSSWDGLSRHGRHARNGGQRRQGNRITRYYQNGVAVYIPYYVYGQSDTTIITSGTVVVGEQAAQPVYGLGQGYQQGYQDSESSEDATPSDLSKDVITILAFQDGTVLQVVEYWLEGELLWYETDYSAITALPLYQLDLSLTQEMNFNLDVPFVLEARR